MIRSKIRKINPQKSNKMIYAVAGGLALLLLVFFALVILSGGRGGARSMAKTLSYLKNTEGLLELKALESEKRVVIVYSSDSKNAGNFEKIAYYAALRLAPHWPDCEVLLARNRVEQVVYRVRVRFNEVIAAEPVERPQSTPTP